MKKIKRSQALACDFKVGKWFINEDGEFVKLIKSYSIYHWRRYQFNAIKETIKVYLDSDFKYYYNEYDFSRKERKKLNKLYDLNSEDKKKVKPKDLNKIVKRKLVKNLKYNHHYLLCNYIETTKGNVPLNVFKLVYITKDDWDDETYTQFKDGHFYGREKGILVHLTYQDKMQYWPQMIGVE